MKLASIAALSAMLAAPAFAAEFDINEKAATAAAIFELATTEFAAQTLAGDGQVAFIVQETANNSALISQVGLNNFATIGQANVLGGGIAAIYQLGNTNVAAINQAE